MSLSEPTRVPLSYPSVGGLTPPKERAEGATCGKMLMTRRLGQAGPITQAGRVQPPLPEMNRSAGGYCFLLAVQSLVPRTLYKPEDLGETGQGAP